METTVSRETAETYLRDIEPKWKRFWFHMHSVAKNLAEFADGIGAISDDVFTYHMSGQKNDFSRWVAEVVGDGVLADELAKVKTKEEAAAVARQRVRELQEALAGG